MKKRRTLDAVLAQADTLLRVWTDNPSFSLGDVTLVSFQALLATHRATRSSVESLRTQLTKGVNDVHDQLDAINDIVVRGRSGMLAQFGKDSAQYDQVGGTRSSERRSPGRKLPAPAKA